MLFIVRPYTPLINLTTLLLLCALFPRLVAGQDNTDAQHLIQRVLERQRSLQRLSYTVQMTDTFVDGNVRHLNAFCDITVDNKDSLFGFSFRGRRADLASQLVYTGGTAFYLDTQARTYSIEMRPGKFITGHPGGQGLFPELVKLDTAGYQAISVTTNDSCYVLRFDYPDLTQYDVSQRYKLFFINKQSLLPVRSYWHQSTLGKQQVIIRQLLSLSLGTAVLEPDDFRQKTFLANYTLLQPRVEKPAYWSLLGKPAPAIRLTDLQGGAASTADHAGKVILLDFWAVWCTPCVASLPKVAAIGEQYKDEGLVVMGILTDTAQTDAAKRLLALRKIGFPQLLSDGRIEKQYKASGVPHYVVIDRKGNITYAQAGFAEEALKEAITRALAE